MALPYLREKHYGADNRLYFFMHELYKVESSKNLEAYYLADEEHRDQIYQDGAPPEEQWGKILHYLSHYRIYLDHQYGLMSGDGYTLKISRRPLKSRGMFRCEYVQDFGSILEFLNAYYGLKCDPASRFYIWQRYHKLARVEYYSPAELAEKLVQLSRELLYRYYTKEYLHNPDRSIKYYSIDFERNHIGVWLHCRDREYNYEYSTVMNFEAV